MTDHDYSLVGDIGDTNARPPRLMLRRQSPRLQSTGPILWRARPSAIFVRFSGGV